MNRNDVDQTTLSIAGAGTVEDTRQNALLMARTKLDALHGDLAREHERYLAARRAFDAMIRKHDNLLAMVRNLRYGKLA